MTSAQIAETLATVSQRLWRIEWSRADLCALLVETCDEGTLRRLSKDVVGTSHRQVLKWAKVARYFDDSTIKRSRRPEYSFRTAVRDAREDGAL